MKFCSFDIETATVTPDGSNPHDFRPLGICCAATQLFEIGPTGVAQTQAIKTWQGPRLSTGLYAAQMNVSDVMEMADYLTDVANDGYFPIGWNSLGFDFDILAEECFSPTYASRMAHMALAHFDPAFQMLCVKGYMAGMQAVAKGLGLPGKLDGMHGDLAPILWAKTAEDQQTVLSYVSQDVQTTTDITIKISQTKRVKWITKAGKPSEFLLKELLPVDECLNIPAPDTSWMSEPRTRASCMAWMKKYGVDYESAK